MQTRLVWVASKDWGENCQILTPPDLSVYYGIVLKDAASGMWNAALLEFADTSISPEEQDATLIKIGVFENLQVARMATEACHSVRMMINNPKNTT